jgi:hypothetical protein
MLHSKLILHRICLTISDRTSQIINMYTLHSLVPLNYRLVDILGLMLSSLMLLLSTLVFVTATCILSSLFAMMLTWQKLIELLQNIDLQDLKRRFTSCQSAVRRTVTSKMAAKSQSSPYKKATDIVHGSTLTSLATPGEPNPEEKFRKAGIL